MKNVRAVSPNDVYYSIEQGIGHLNTKGPSKVPEIVVNDTASDMYSLTTFDVYGEYLAYGSYDGKICLYSLEKSKFLKKDFEIAQGEGMIVNTLQFITSN